MVSAYTTRSRALGAMAAFLALLTLAPGEAAAGPGWSSRPRWNLPRERPNPCARGWKHRSARAITRLRDVGCVEDAPTPAASQPAPTSAERPSSSPRPQPRPAEPEDHRETLPLPAAPRPSEPPPTRWPRAIDFGDAPDANALMAMNARRCHAFLREHEVAFTELGRREAPEVEIPVRLAGPIAGVTYTIPWSKDPASDPHTIWDCRLVAAMIPLSRWLAAQGVHEVQYFSALRRGDAARQKPRSQHNLGLGLDILGFRRGDEALAKVEETYPRRTLRNCPATTPALGAAVAEVYLALVCVAVEHSLVHTLLTPDHDRAHHNHLHLDLKADQRAPVDPYVSFAP